MGKAKHTLEECKHPKSRKTQAFVKKKARDKRCAAKKLTNVHKQNRLGEKLLWFKENLPATTATTDVRSTIGAYLSRFDEELRQIKLKNETGGGRRNRQHASREAAIEATLAEERREFESCGVEIPDLTDPHQVKMLRDWDGQLRFLPNFRLRRFTAS